MKLPMHSRSHRLEEELVQKEASDYEKFVAFKRLCERLETVIGLTRAGLDHYRETAPNNGWASRLIEKIDNP